MTTTSLSLLERAQRDGDPQAWQRLVDLYSPLLASWLRRYTLQPCDADDLVQEVLLTMARELPHFEHAGGSGAFRAWLRTILTYRLKHYWRTQRRRPRGCGDSEFLRTLRELEDPQSELSQLWDREHDQYLLARLIELIAPRFQPVTMQAFHRVMIQGQAADRAAGELKISLNAVVIAKSRVLKELRREAKGLLDA